MTDVDKLLDRLNEQEQRHHRELAGISSLVLSVDQTLSQAEKQERPDLMLACIQEARRRVAAYVQVWKLSALPTADALSGDASRVVHTQPQRAGVDDTAPPSSQ